MSTSQLTFTRFIAAFLIVIYHFGGKIWFTDSEAEVIVREHFNLGVSFFYVLSGFVMMIAYGTKQKVDTKDYYINRVARIFPLHWFTLLLSIIVSILISINYLEYFNFSLSTFFINAILLQAWIPDISLSFNVPSWSISVELFFYFCFPFIYNYFITKYKGITITALILIVWVIFQVWMNHFYLSPDYKSERLNEYFLNYNPFLHLNQFLIGILSGYFFNNYKKRFAGNFDIYIILLVLMTFSLTYFLHGYFLNNGIFALNFALIIFLTALNTGFITKVFNHPILIHLGNISFALYLLQNPVFIFLNKIFRVLKIDNPYIIFFVGVGALLVASHLSYRFVEIPLQKRIRNLKKLR